MGNEVLGRDLALEDTFHGKDLPVVDGDIAVVKGVDNLVQALELRLSSHRGGLRKVGHPSYGSRLSETVGLVGTEGNLRRVENLVREAILQEPRVRCIESVTVSSSVAVPGTVEVEVSVLALAEPTPLNLVIALQTDR